MNFITGLAGGYCVVGAEQTSALWGFDVVGREALLADHSLDLTALAISIAGLRARLGEVGAVDVDVGGAGQDIVEEERVVDCC